MDWDLINKLIIFTRNNNILILTIFSGYADYHLQCYGQSQEESSNTNTMDTYVPLQFVANKFGMTVFYHPETLQIHLLTNTLPQMQPEIVYRVETLKKKSSTNL